MQALTLTLIRDTSKKCRLRNAELRKGQGTKLLAPFIVYNVLNCCLGEIKCGEDTGPLDQALSVFVLDFR